MCSIFWRWRWARWAVFYATRYQNVPQQSNFYHSLPVTRQGLLSARILALVLVQVLLLIVVTMVDVGVVLMTAVLFMNAALLLRVDEIAQFAVPTLRLAKDISPVLGALFSVVLLCGIFSTAAPMMWTVCSKLAPVGTKKSIIIAAVLTAAAFGLGQLPFGTLVGFIYPIRAIWASCCWCVWQVSAFAALSEKAT